MKTTFRPIFATTLMSMLMEHLDETTDLKRLRFRVEFAVQRRGRVALELGQVVVHMRNSHHVHCESAWEGSHKLEMSSDNQYGTTHMTNITTTYRSNASLY